MQQGLGHVRSGGSVWRGFPALALPILEEVLGNTQLLTVMGLLLRL